MKRKHDQQRHPQQKKTPRGGPEAKPALPELPAGPRFSESGRPEGNPGRVDVTGVMPDNIRVDPDITEGHEGYQESGDSEIIPLDRLAKGEQDPQKSTKGASKNQ